VELTPELNSGQALQGFINWFKQAKTISSLKAEFQFSDSLGWDGSVSAFTLLRGRQNRKIFFSLIEKNFGGVRLKKCRENFSVLPVAVAPQRSAG
jgi:hypothetical protein